MDKNNRKIASIVVFALLFGLLFSVIVYANSNAAVPKIYVNDKAWFKHEVLSYEKVGQSYFVPVSVFEDLPNVKVTYFPKGHGVYNILISHGEKYITLHTEQKSAIDHNFEKFFIDVQFFKGEYYLPVNTTTTKLGIFYETIVDQATNEILLRISDGSQKLSFEELVNKYRPITTVITTRPQVTETTPQVSETTPQVSQTRPPVTETRPPVTETRPPVTETTPIYTGPKTPLYLTFKNLSMNTNMVFNVLELLEKNTDIKATFFLNYSDIKNNPDLVIELFISGHQLGLILENGYTDSTEMMENLDKTNNLLYQLIKRKSQIIMYENSSVELSDNVYSDIQNAGYHIWDYTHKLDNKYTTDSYNGISKMKKDIDNSTVFILNSDFGKYAHSNIKRLIDYINSSNRYYYKPIYISNEPYTISR